MYTHHLQPLGHALRPVLGGEQREEPRAGAEVEDGRAGAPARRECAQGLLERAWAVSMEICMSSN